MKVSVFMMTYNHEPFIAQAIESVLAQDTPFDLELVIGEDQSADGTRRICEEYRSRFPDRIRLLPGDRRIGQMRNFARTINACRGTYIAKLEGDDYWIEPKKLQMQAEFLDNHPDVVLHYTNAVAFDEGQPEKRQVMIAPGEREPFIGVEDLVRGNQVVTQTCMYRNLAPWNLPPLFLKGTQGDWPFFCLLARHGKIAFTDEVTGAYRRHGGGVFTRRSDTEKLYKNAMTHEAIDRMLGFRYRCIAAPIIRSKYLKVYHYGMASREWRYAVPGALRLIRRAIVDRCPPPELRRIIRGLMPARFRKLD